jgi:hypothetical protein
MPRINVWISDVELVAKVTTAAAAANCAPARVVEDALRAHFAPAAKSEKPHRWRTVETFDTLTTGKVCPVCDVRFVSQTVKQRFCGRGNRTCMKYYGRARQKLAESGKPFDDAAAYKLAKHMYQYKHPNG